MDLNCCLDRPYFLRIRFVATSSSLELWTKGHQTNASPDQGVFGNVLVNEDFLRTVGNPSATAQGTMTSVYNLGCFGGALSTLYTGDRLGRPRTLILGSVTIAIGAVVQAACMNAGMQYAGRVIAGCGTGMNTATAGKTRLVTELAFVC